jgi:DNA-binding NarL/FixJ family response regulator
VPLSGPVRTVLIVDDSAPIRRALCEEFTRHGFNVCAEAENGSQAIELARRCRPELIILDLSIPVMNGLEAAPELRKIVPDCPIILYSLFADTLGKSELEARGITLALSKDSSVEVLLEKAEALFQT